MTKRYKQELQNLGQTFEIASRADVSSLSRILEQCVERPMLAIGSGGSFSTASFAALLHEHFTGCVARAATPLEYLTAPGTKASVVCFTASGRNRDIASAFKLAAIHEGGLVGALVMATDTPIHALQTRFKYTQVADYPNEKFTDGFLAVSSLVASSILLTRAYEKILGLGPALPNSLNCVARNGVGRDSFDALGNEFGAVTERNVVSVLYTPSAKPAAIDLESRFVEAALLPLHIADLRNFGHGRHHWIAKRGHETGVISLVGDNLTTLADRTSSLLPSEVAHQRIDLSGPVPLQAMTSIIVGMHIAESAGRSVGIDPGKPGIPEFGRKLYRLGPGSSKQDQSKLNLRAAICRKSSTAEYGELTQRTIWEAAYMRAHRKFQTTPINGVVFDYDGTLCASDQRFEPLIEEVGIELCKLLTAGLKVGIATGRGPSAGKALRNLLPTECWKDVFLGYYNGSIVLPLADDRDPIAYEMSPDPILAALMHDPLFSSTTPRSNTAQISIRFAATSNLSPAISAARRIVKEIGVTASVVASSHSIDIVRGSASKLSVVDTIISEIANKDTNVLRIGDRGSWPGNDFDLLDHPLGLSVEETSSHPNHCWNFAPAGVLGVQATLYYLSRIQINAKGTFLRMKPNDRGY